MASFTNMLIIAFMIEVIMVLSGFTTIPGSSLYTFLTNPSQWDESSFWSVLNLTLDAVTGATIIIGLIFFRTDFIVMVPVVIMFFSFGAGLGNLYAQISGLFGPEGGPVIAMLFISPMILLYILLSLDWWRNRVD